MKTAAFTIVQDDPEFLGLWLRYYGRFFRPSDLYVLDNDTDSCRSTAAVCGLFQGCDAEPVWVPTQHTTSFDHNWLRDTVESFQRFLFQSYDRVLFAEVDEFLVPGSGDLGRYVADTKGPVRATGFNVVHQPDEYPIDLSKPILWQRKFMRRCPMYDKTLISDDTLSWSIGFHTAKPVVIPDDHLTLFHLHRVDYQLCHRRHQRAAGRRWSPIDLAIGYGRQNRIVAEDEFRHWFHNDPEVGTWGAELGILPQAVRSAI